MTVTEKVVLAENAVTVHVKRTSEPSLLPDGSEAWDIESKIVFPGETVALSDMPPYLSDAVKKGQVPGLKMMTPAQAKKRAELIEELTGSASPPEIEEAEEDSEFPAEEF